jgi:hypothetical protein
VEKETKEIKKKKMRDNCEKARTDNDWTDKHHE